MFSTCFMFRLQLSMENYSKRTCKLKTLTLKSIVLFCLPQRFLLKPSDVQGEWMSPPPTPPRSFFLNFDKRIYSGMPKLSVAVYLSLPDILVWQPIACIKVHALHALKLLCNRVMVCRFTQILNF